jgi:putative transposase
MQEHGSAADLVFIEERALERARRREDILKFLDEGTGPLGPRVQRLAEICRVSDRTVRRWLYRYRERPGVTTLVPDRRGPRLGLRRLGAAQENTITDVIEAWTRRQERLPIAWIVEECARRCKAAALPVPSRNTIAARLRDKGISSLKDGKDVIASTDGVTGRIIDLLRLAAVDALGHKSKSVGIEQLLIAGANLPAIINQRGEFPI